MPNFIPKSQVRKIFSDQLHKLYKLQTPLYAQMESIVAASNKRTLLTSRSPFKRMNQNHMGHGAIRLASLTELKWARSAFSPLDMHPLGYYDLSPTGLPIHSTAFTPLRPEVVPFRMFTSVLNIDLLPLPLQAMLEPLLKERQIFSDALRGLIEKANVQDGLTESEAEEYALKLADAFKYSYDSKISYEDYCTLLKAPQGELIADIFAFPYHLNHCTHRAINIDDPHKQMQAHDMETISAIQGPPSEYEILLRQTSYKARDMFARFKTRNNAINYGLHRTGFGEIEQRGAALTQNGEALYDKCLTENDFSAFPKDLDQAWERGLMYCEFKLSKKALDIKETALLGHAPTLITLIRKGILIKKPMYFEGFLPVSASKIFESNMQNTETSVTNQQKNSQVLFEEGLGMPVIDSHDYYKQKQALFIDACYKTLQIQMPKKLFLECKHAISKGPLPMPTRTQRENYAQFFTPAVHPNTKEPNVPENSSHNTSHNTSKGC